MKEINPGAEGSDPAAFVTLNGLTYFRANNGVHGFELWRTDGTEAGTELVIDVFTVAHGRLFFVAIVPDDARFTVRTQLWVTDGSEAGTQLVYEEPGNDFGYGIENLTGLGNQLLFTAPNDVDADGFSTDKELFAVSLD